jgi:hypothetical protein
MGNVEAGIPRLPLLRLRRIFARVATPARLRRLAITAIALVWGCSTR